MRTTESQFSTDTELAKIAWLSAQSTGQVFHSLMHHINVDALRCAAVSNSWMERKLLE